MAGRPRKITALVLCHLRGGPRRPEVGSLVTPGELDENLLQRHLQAGELGFRQMEILATPDHLALPLRRVRASSRLLVPATPQQAQADEQAREAREVETNAQQLRQARSALAEAQAEHSAARKRMVKAQEAVNSLGENNDQ